MLDINKFKSEIQKYDVERPNLFTTYIYMPRSMHPDLQEYMSSLYNPLRLFAQNVSMPDIRISTNPVKRYGFGPNQLMPVGVEFNNTVSITYINDASARLYTLFYNWIRSINPADNRIPAAGTPSEIDGEEVANPAFVLSYQDTYVSEINITTYRGSPGKFGGSGLGQLALSAISSGLGVPFVGSLFGSRAAPEFQLEPIRRIALLKAYPIAMSEVGLSSSSTDAYSTFTVTFAYHNYRLGLAEQAAADSSSSGLFGGIF